LSKSGSAHKVLRHGVPWWLEKFRADLQSESARWYWWGWGSPKFAD
jgi:hypothetical protein